jgi:hypothetical protein
MLRKLSSAAVTLAGLLALSGMAAADGPAYRPATATPVVTGAPVVTGTPVVAGAPGPCCGADGCAEKCCKPITDTRKVIKPHYTHVCEDYCEVRCWGCSLFGGGCCGEHACSRVKTRKILVVRLRPEEQCVNKCAVDYKVAEPCHTPAPCATPHHAVVPAPAYMPAAARPLVVPAPGYLPATPRPLP